MTMSATFPPQFFSQPPPAQRAQVRAHLLSLRDAITQKREELALIEAEAYRAEGVLAFLDAQLSAPPIKPPSPPTA